MYALLGLKDVILFEELFAGAQNYPRVMGYW